MHIIFKIDTKLLSFIIFYSIISNILAIYKIKN